MAPSNVLIAQSGGPSPVINATLIGIIDGCRAHPNDFGNIYAGHHGIEGVLREALINIDAQDEAELKLLRTTPAAGAIGTCRYKLDDPSGPDYRRLIEVLKTHNIGVFFYIGGGDSMDTCHKIGQLAETQGLDLIAVGAPKTIDNDLGDPDFKLIDHTPGYGSCARFWSHYMTNIEEENRGSCTSDAVMVVQAMGRKAGFIPAAARLADPERTWPLQIYTVEGGLSLEALVENVHACLRERGRCMAVVSEGFDVGSLGTSSDRFGHTEYGASRMTVAQKVINALNSSNLPVSGTAHCQVPGTDQRHAMAYASEVDLEEAYQVGQHCARIALKRENGWMATLLREAGADYNIRYDQAPLQHVANFQRMLPTDWVDASGMDVTDAFIRYATPLIGLEPVSLPLENGRPRYARLRLEFVGRKLPDYTPENWR